LLSLSFHHNKPCLLCHLCVAFTLVESGDATGSRWQLHAEQPLEGQRMSSEPAVPERIENVNIRLARDIMTPTFSGRHNKMPSVGCKCLLALPPVILGHQPTS